MGSALVVKGLITPPVGVVFFVACSIREVPISKVIGPLLPFIGAPDAEPPEDLESANASRSRYSMIRYTIGGGDHVIGGCL